MPHTVTRLATLDIARADAAAETASCASLDDAQERSAPLPRSAEIQQPVEEPAHEEPPCGEEAPRAITFRRLSSFRKMPAVVHHNLPVNVEAELVVPALRNYEQWLEQAVGAL